MVRALHGIRYARFEKTKRNIAVRWFEAKLAPQKRETGLRDPIGT